MDAVEYEKSRHRMCRTNILKKGGCEGCKAYSILRRRCGFAVDVVKSEAEDADVIQKNIAIIEQWVKDNPVKTRKSEFKKMFPNANMYSITNTFCTAHFDKKKACEVSVASEKMCKKCRYKYWNEEVTDND